MKEYIVDLILEYGLETIILALIINILTTIIKIPIKKYAKRLSDSKKVTRFIVFIPILIGFIITLLYSYLCNNNFLINKEVLKIYTTSTSLSLSFYAIYEKLIYKKSDNNVEVEASQEVINMINSVIGEEKIILKGSKKNGIN